MKPAVFAPPEKVDVVAKPSGFFASVTAVWRAYRQAVRDGYTSSVDETIV